MMCKLVSAICCILLFTVVSCQQSGEGECFHFNGDSFLNFSPDGYDNDGFVLYSLQFRTTKDNGIILYCVGLTGDYESLYVRDGKLHYLLFNRSPSGVEGTSGAYFFSNENVDTGEWVTVNLFRSMRIHRPRRGRSSIYRTGFNVTVGNGQTATYAENRRCLGVDLSSTISIGGFRTRLSDEVENFEGDIRNIREAKNGVDFEEPALNFAGRVERGCFEPPTPL